MKENRTPVSRSSRRRFLSLWVMGAGLTAAYGLFASFVLRFLHPRRAEHRWRRMFVCFSDHLPPGTSRDFTTPKGEQVILTNTGELQSGGAHTLLAFSSRCPHLGCKVHYDPEQKQFICPCHMGAFDQRGVAIAGPPAQAGQRLSQYEVSDDGNSIYMRVEVV